MGLSRNRETQVSPSVMTNMRAMRWSVTHLRTLLRVHRIVYDILGRIKHQEPGTWESLLQCQLTTTISYHQPGATLHSIGSWSFSLTNNSFIVLKTWLGCILQPPNLNERFPIHTLHAVAMELTSSSICPWLLPCFRKYPNIPNEVCREFFVDFRIF